MKNLELYNDARATLLAQNDTNFCVPVALSIVSGVDVNEVNRGLMTTPSTWTRGMMRNKRQGVYQPDWECFTTKHLGLVMTDITSTIRAKTITTLARELNPGKRYLVKIRRHLIAFADGKIQDWTDGRRHKVQQVFEISGGDIPAAPVAPAPVVVPAAPVAPRPVAPRPSPLLDKLAIEFPGATIKQSGRWVSVKFEDGYAIKITVTARGDARLCFNMNDRAGIDYAITTFGLGNVNQRAKDVTVTGMTEFEAIQFLGRVR